MKKGDLIKCLTEKCFFDPFHTTYLQEVDHLKKGDYVIFIEKNNRFKNLFIINVFCKFGVVPMSPFNLKIIK